MDHVKVWFGVSIVLGRGRDIEIGCTYCSNYDHNHKIQSVRFAAKLSLVTIVGIDENQAGTMFRITFDISLLRLRSSDRWPSTAIWVALYCSLGAPYIILPSFSLG